jgi:putative flippase GtrA
MSSFQDFRSRFRDTRERAWEALVAAVVGVFFSDTEARAQNRIYTTARRNQYELKRFVKFAMVGVTGLAVDYAVLNVLAHVFHVESWLAMAVAFIVAATNNFIWNIAWVYPESRQEFWRHFPTFLAVNAVGLGINELILFLCEAPIERLAGSAVIGLNLTKGIAAMVVMVWNFLINRFVTFRHVRWEKVNATLASERSEPQEQIESAL